MLKRIDATLGSQVTGMGFVVLAQSMVDGKKYRTGISYIGRKKKRAFSSAANYYNKTILLAHSHSPEHREHLWPTTDSYSSSLMTNQDAP